MPKISVIVPVYKAEKTLRKCVESILFGQERDLELILVEDCSGDGSWAMCQQLAAEYPQVRCLQNPKNSGVSHTRNRGLEAATGKYILFVDSDDWVSGSYARTLVDTWEANSDALVVCGYTFLDHTMGLRRYYGITDTAILPRQDFFRLAEEVLLQQLWNKIFLRQTIVDANIRFDEAISMGEDHQFVLDYIRAAELSRCVVIPQALYYYIRWTNSSLMSYWGQLSDLEKTLDRVEQLLAMTGDKARAQSQREGIRRQYVHRICADSALSKAQKLENIRLVVGDGAAACYRAGRSMVLREKLGNLRRKSRRFSQRLAGRRRFDAAKKKITAARKALTAHNLTILSQNCIGGVFSHDMKLEFRSPTVNLFIPAGDYLKFLADVEGYLAAELEFSWGEEYPLAKLKDITLHFVHYDTCQQASQAWMRRKNRVDLQKIVVLSTDRDGFDADTFQAWKAIPYPKLLFTARREFADHPDVVYYPKYEANGCIPDLIPSREFYKDGKLLALINGAYQ